jgi:hypothetical protein
MRRIRQKDKDIWTAYTKWEDRLGYSRKGKNVQDLGSARDWINSRSICSFSAGSEKMKLERGRA